MTKKEMIFKLLEASDAYYNKSKPIMSDAEYDDFYNSFTLKYPNDPFLKTVGSPVDPATKWEKATHKIPMGSLDKVTNSSTFMSWSKKYNVNGFVVSEKLDGISIDLEYENGTLVKAITRGDGIIGEDITKNVVKMQNVKKRLPGKFTGSLRGEIILKKEDFESIVSIQKQRNETLLKNLRNGASGIAKRYDGKYSEYLSIIYFDITKKESNSSKFSNIEKLGLPTSQVKWGWGGGVASIYNDLEVAQKYEEYESDTRSNLDYEIDGLVVEINDLNVYNSLGEKDGRPKGAVAFKFTSMKKETRIIGIEWSLGNNGHVTPVALLEPIELGGAMISRVSLHNLDIFNNFKLYKGAKVLISRRGDVIPYLERVIE